MNSYSIFESESEKLLILAIGRIIIWIPIINYLYSDKFV